MASVDAGGGVPTASLVHGLPVGPPVDPSTALRPLNDRYEGSDVTLELMDAARHGPAIYDVLKASPSLWTYMLSGPFADEKDLIAMLDQLSSHSPQSGNLDRNGNPTMYLFAIVNNASKTAQGYVALFRIDWAHCTAEIGHVMLGPTLQRTRGATEALGMLQRAAFDDMGNRRLEWKCNHLHQGSRRAALRLGYTFEGVFRKHYIVKGHSRDTAWFSITDDEWPLVRAGLLAWLDSTNFNADGTQKRSLQDLREEAKATVLGA